jgi:hypothetical protein
VSIIDSGHDLSATAQNYRRPQTQAPDGLRRRVTVGGLFLEKLVTAHADGRLRFFGAHAKLADRDAFAQYLVPSRKVEWVGLQ